MKKTIKVNKVESLKSGKVDRVVLHYEVLDGPKKGEVWKIGALKVKLDEASRNLLTGSEGDLRDITIEKDGNYWNLTKVEATGSMSTQSSGEYNKSTTNSTKTASSKPFDDVGIKVGAARNQAIAYLSATKGTKFTLDDVDATAYEIVERQSAQEATVRAGNNPAKPEALVEQSQQQSYDDSEVIDEFGF
jgi:hypothetical protein